MPNPAHGTAVVLLDELEVDERLVSPENGRQGRPYKDTRPGWVTKEIERRRLERLAFFRDIAARQERARETGVKVMLSRRWFGPSFVAGQ